ncbi:retrovirus-related pol polyprotein from transposon TNT 1-94 [Tanacetum coccineum]
MQLEQEVFQNDESFVSQNTVGIQEYFEINDWKARLQDKDTTICKLKDTIKSLSKNTKEENMNHDKCKLEPINEELENSVAKLLLENERLCNEINHVKRVFKDQFDSIKQTRVHHKEHYDSLINKLNLKSVENEDLKAQIQEKVFVITSLKNDLQKSKGKEVGENDVHPPSATTISPGMFKLDLVPLPPRLVQNREVHLNYLRHAQEQANTLREIVEQAKAKQPLDRELDLACKHTIRIQKLLVYVQDTCPNTITPSTKKVESSNTSDSNTLVLSSTGVKCSISNCRSKPPSNKKNDRSSQTPSRNKKNKVEAQPRKVVQIVFWYLDSGCSKHMSGNHSQLMNFVSKFLGTVRFKNDQIARIMGYGDYQLGTVVISRSNATSSRGNTTSGQARVVKCYNCQGEGHMARQCTQPKRPRNAAWYKEKAMLAEAQEAGQILDEEQLAFLADPGIPADQAQTIIPHNAAFQTEDLDTYDSDCDDLSTAQAVLMANISNYGSDIISEVPNSETYLNDMDNQSVQALQDFEQTPVMDFTDNEISSDSNIIPYSQYLQETQQETVQDTNLQAQQDSMILSVIEQILIDDFEKRFSPQQELSAEQAFWFHILNPSIESSYTPPVIVEVPSELPKVSLVNASLKKLKFHLTQFDSVVKKRKTPNALEEGEWGFEHTKTVFNNEIIPFLKSLKDIFNVFDKDLLNEITEVFKDQFDSIKQTRVHHKEQSDSLINKLNFIKSVEIEDLKAQIQDKVFVITSLKNDLRKLKGREIDENVVHVPSATTIALGMFKLNLELLPPRQIKGMIGSHNHQVGTKKYKVRKPKPGTVRFGNNQIARIIGYGNYQLGNVIISIVYYIEGLGHNLFSVGQFCDTDLKVAFWKNTCFIRNLEACALGKSKKSSHQPKAEDTNQEKLYLLHMDLCGPMRVASINGKRYILVIVDDYSRFTLVRFLKIKDEAPTTIIKCIKNIQVRLKATVRNVRTDNGTEFVNQTLREWYENVGITHQTSVARTPQQNGVVERRNWTLVEAARTMLIFSKALLFLWAEAINTACYTQNRSLIRL